MIDSRTVRWTDGWKGFPLSLLLSDLPHILFFKSSTKYIWRNHLILLYLFSCEMLVMIRAVIVVPISVKHLHPMTSSAFTDWMNQFNYFTPSSTPLLISLERKEWMHEGDEWLSFLIMLKRHVSHLRVLKHLAVCWCVVRCYMCDVT